MKFIEKKAHSDNYTLEEEAKRVIIKGAAQVCLIILFKESSASVQHNFFANATLLIVPASLVLILSASVSFLKMHQNCSLWKFCMRRICKVNTLTDISNL